MIKKKTTPKNKQDWTTFTYGLMAGLIILLFVLIIQDSIENDVYEMSSKDIMKQAPIPSYTPSEANLCNNIRGTPAWVKDNQIIGYGYTELEPQNLVDNKVVFLYNPDCIHCQRQVEYWGEDEFNDLSAKGLAIDCTRY